MTRVSYGSYDERIYFEASGHAVADAEGAFTGEGEAASVCAAVSILMLAAASKFDEMDRNGDFVYCNITVEPGYVCFDVQPREDARQATTDVIELLVCGIALLEENYPELVALI